MNTNYPLSYTLFTIAFLVGMIAIIHNAPHLRRFGRWLTGAVDSFSTTRHTRRCINKNTQYLRNTRS